MTYNNDYNPDELYREPDEIIENNEPCIVCDELPVLINGVWVCVNCHPFALEYQ
jgi:hypothetical protein